MSNKKQTEAIESLNTKYSEDVERYKFFASQRRGRRKFTQEKLTQQYSALAEYVESRAEKKQPLTVAGAILASDFNEDAWYKAKSGEMDYLLEEYIALNQVTEETIIDGLPYHINSDGEAILLKPYSWLIQNTMLLIQEQREIACSSLRGNPAGNIFLLKAQMGFKEDSQPSTVNQTLVIADKEQAVKALEWLK